MYAPPSRFLVDRWSATANIAPMLSDGCPHSFASQVSLKSNHLIAVVVAAAACATGILCANPGTRTPCEPPWNSRQTSITVLHSSTEFARNAHPIESIRHSTAFDRASSLYSASSAQAYSAILAITSSYGTRSISIYPVHAQSHTKSLNRVANAFAMQPSLTKATRPAAKQRSHRPP